LCDGLGVADLRGVDAAVVVLEAALLGRTFLFGDDPELAAVFLDLVGVIDAQPRLRIGGTPFRVDRLHADLARTSLRNHGKPPETVDDNQRRKSADCSPLWRRSRPVQISV